MVVFCDASHAPMRATQRKGISGAFIFVLSSLVKGFHVTRRAHHCQAANPRCLPFKRRHRRLWVSYR